MNAPMLIVGAGIAGIAAAYELAVKHGQTAITLIDERDPLSLTSDKSTECYRNWWPDAAMVWLMNRSIDRLEELAQATHNTFRLNRRGYLYATADPHRIAHFRHAAQLAATHGAGPLRENAYTPNPADPHIFTGIPAGADLLTDPALIRQHFPYLTEQTVAVLHARRAGWFSSTEFGMMLLEQAKARGVKLIQARVTGIDVEDGRVCGARLSNGECLPASIVINAAGPLAHDLARRLGVDLPIFCERHTKAAFHDTDGVIPRDAPLLIWADPQRLAWRADERAFWAEADDTRWLLDTFPAGAHTRPEGGSGSDIVLMLWAYDARPIPAQFPPQFDEAFVEVVLRGLTTMLPALQRYIGRASAPRLDGGYYVKTRENRPLIGPLPVAGAYLIGALSGFGIMAACGAAELLAAHVLGLPLPPEAAAFALARYADPTYPSQLAQWDEGQL
jgi:glycine/D-amino acid oxidase-like deaminating enzyme